MEEKKKKLILALFLAGIILLGVLLRLTFLSSIPNGFFCDEAVRGYDAYSILLTGRDQYGEFLPLFTRSLDDYPESFYVFLAVPSVAFFGLNEFAARLPAGLIGLLTIPVLYFLTKEFFGRRVALIAALLLAISPWHLQFSRSAMSSYTLMPLFFCLGLLFFMKAVSRGKRFFLYLSSLIFSISLYTYYSARIFVPIFVFGMCVIFFKELRKAKKESIIGAVMFLSVLIFLSFFWISAKGLSRINESLILSLPQNIRYYLSYFNPYFLFIRGDSNLLHSIRNVGQLHLFEAFTVLAGLGAVLAGLRKKEYRIFLLWLVLYPIPACFGLSPNAARSIIGAPLFVILSAVGIFTLISIIKPRILRVGFVGALSIVILFSALIYCKNYFFDYPKYGASWWQYGMKEAVTYADNSPYDRVIVSNSLTMAHTFILFYTAYPPLQCQEALRRGKFSFGKFHICFLSEDLKVKGKWLFIVEPGETDKLSDEYDFKILRVIKDPLGNKLIELVEVNNKRRVK
jgi:4-amino-4-deoxy-L-arabinose transferase-like glycosyltransferase